jgi:hypothetical protein
LRQSRGPNCGAVTRQQVTHGDLVTLHVLVPADALHQREPVFDGGSASMARESARTWVRSDDTMLGST